MQIPRPAWPEHLEAWGWGWGPFCVRGGGSVAPAETQLLSQLVPEHVVMTKEEVTELLAR